VALTPDPIANNPALSDLDYLKSKMKKDTDMEEAEEEDIEEEEEEEVAPVKVNPPKKEKKQSNSSAPKEPMDTDTTEDAKDTSPQTDTNTQDMSSDVGSTGRLFIRNLSFLTTEEELVALFKKYGPISEVHIPLSKDTKSPKGIAFIKFLKPPDALTAMNALDGATFHGRLLHVLPSQGAVTAKESKDNKPKTYKEKKEQERKKTADSQQYSWNSLFMGVRNIQIQQY
jgi:multiple RNA-binding domain-containing protein 1